MRGFNLSTKGLTLKNVAFVGGLMTFTFLAYAFIAPRLVTPTPVPAPTSRPTSAYGPGVTTYPQQDVSSLGGGMITPGNIVSGQYARAYPGYGRYRMGRRINVS